MTHADPTAADLRRIASNMRVAGEDERAQTLTNAADLLDVQAAKLERWKKYGVAVFNLWDIRNNMPDTYTTLAKSIVKQTMTKTRDMILESPTPEKASGAGADV